MIQRRSMISKRANDLFCPQGYFRKTSLRSKNVGGGHLGANKLAVRYSLMFLEIVLFLFRSLLLIGKEVTLTPKGSLRKGLGEDSCIKAAL